MLLHRNNISQRKNVEIIYNWTHKKFEIDKLFMWIDLIKKEWFNFETLFCKIKKNCQYKSIRVNNYQTILVQIKYSI